MKFLFGLLLAVISCFALTKAAKPAACLLPHSKDGNGVLKCAAYIPSWSYNSAQNKCVQFVYGGCQGNDNRFPSKQSCERSCK